MSSILDLLGGAAGGAPNGPAAGPPPGPDPSDMGGGPADAGEGDWESQLRDVVAQLRALAHSADDDQETQVVDQCIFNLSKLLGTRQSQDESALGVTAAHKSMGRAYRQ